MFDRFLAGLKDWLGPADLGWMLQSESVARSGTVLGATPLQGGPISCMALIQVTTGDESMDFIRATYIVPDARVVSSELSKLRIRSSKARAFPLLGSPLRTTWSGDDRAQGVINMLNRQRALNSYSREMDNLTIAAVPDEGCWTMTTHVGTRGSIIADSLSLAKRLLAFPAPVQEGLRVPTSKDLICYQAVARRLLRARLG
jgi:hypothetical protein